MGKSTNNGDLPAQSKGIVDTSLGQIQAVGGFTKREEMAVRFVAAMLAAGSQATDKDICESANDLADALLKSWEDDNG